MRALFCAKSTPFFHISVLRFYCKIRDYGWRANEIGTASNSAEKKNRPREGVGEGGLGGIPPRPREIKLKTAPPSCSFRAEPRKIVFFSF